MDLDAEFARFTAELKSVEETVAAQQAEAPAPLAPPPVRRPPQVSWAGSFTPKMPDGGCIQCVCVDKTSTGHCCFSVSTPLV